MFEDICSKSEKVTNIASKISAFCFGVIIGKSIIWVTLHVLCFFVSLNLKRLGEGRIQYDTTCGFSKNTSSREGGGARIFVTFKIIIGLLFTNNFIRVPQVVQEIWSFSPSIFTILVNFLDFWYFLVAKKLMPAYYRWWQHFLFFNLL